MIIPQLNNSRVYDGIVNDEILGSRISPCENYLAIITKDSLQIVSNRHNRILISRYILSDISDGEFDGSLDWSGNSRLLILGSSTQQHVFIFRLDLQSPLEISNDSGYLSELDSSSDDLTSTSSISNDDDNDETRQLKDNFFIADSILKVNNNNERFVFITEELENGLTSIPSVNVPEEIFDNFQEDLLSFQLISEYGTLTEKNQVVNSETGVEFSTSYVKLEFAGTINIFHKFNSFLILFDPNTMQHVILFALKIFPIIHFVMISNSKLSRKNLFLTDLISTPYEYDLRNSHGSCSFIHPIYSLEPIERICFSGYLDTSESNKEINLEILDRLSISDHIKENLSKQSYSFDQSNSQNYLPLSLLEVLLTQSHLEAKPNFSEFGVINLEYNEIHDWIIMIIQPLNSLLLFSWNSSLHLGLSQESDHPHLNLSKPPFGFIVKDTGTLMAKMLNKHSRIVLICDESIKSTKQIEICNDQIDHHSFEFEFMDDDGSYYSKVNECNPVNNRELFIEVLSLEDNEHLQRKDNILHNTVKINRIYILKLSELLCNTCIFSHIPTIEISNNDMYITIVLDDGIFVINSFSGKLHFKINPNNGEYESPNTTSFKHASMISNDLSMLYQVQLKSNNNDSPNENDAEHEHQHKFYLIELPLYRLLESRSLSCKVSSEDKDLPYCENLIFIGMESMGLLHCNSRSLNLDSISMESANKNNISLEDLHHLNKNTIEPSSLHFNTTSNHYQGVNPDLGGVIASCLELYSDLTLQSIPIPPSIYINHNWPIREAYINRSGNYILVSGYRGCAVYDLINSRWRLFCDLNHELLLCKPNLPFGWVNEWIFFLSVDSSLLLNTFHDLITSDDIWQISAFEKNKLYEAYIQALTGKLKPVRGHQDESYRHGEVCFVFFDIRNSLDIRNIIGIIPFCSSHPLLIANSIYKFQDDLFVLYTSDFVLTAYEDLDSSQYTFIPSEIKWMIDLSEVWRDHPVEILLIKKNTESCTFIVLHKDWRLYRLTVLYQQNENVLNKKCEYKLERIQNSCIEAEESLNLHYSSNVMKFGFIEFPLSCKDTDYLKDPTPKASSSYLQSKCAMNQTWPNSDQILEDAVQLLQNELNFPPNILELLHSCELKRSLEDCTSPHPRNALEKSPLYWDGIEEYDLSGIIWYLTESQQIFFLPLIEESNDEDASKRSPLSPILVQSFQTKLSHTHIVNFFPGLSSFIALDSHPQTRGIGDQSCSDKVSGRATSFLIIESRPVLKLYQSISPILQDLINIQNLPARSKIIREFIHPLVSYIKMYPLESILNILVNVFENMLFSMLKDSCKDYKKSLKEKMNRVISLSERDDSVAGKVSIQDLSEVFYTVAPNLRICRRELCNHYRKMSLMEMIQHDIMVNSQSIRDVIQVLELVQESLPLLDTDSTQSNVFTYLVISVIRKIDPVIASCIVFPAINRSPSDLFKQCMQFKSYSNAMLYLTVMQYSVGPYLIRLEDSLLLLENILIRTDVTNYNKLFPLVSQTLKFIFLIFKPSNISIKTPLAEIQSSLSIVGPSSCNNTKLDLDAFISKIDGILEFHFVSKLMQIEWTYITIMCNNLGMSFNAWLTHCLKKYHPLWFSNQDLESLHNLSSPSFSNLVISIRHKFCLFNIMENSISLFDDDTQQTPHELPETTQTRSLANSYNIHLPKDNPEILLQNLSTNNKPIDTQTIKLFFKAFLSNSFPLPALAIAFACNDVYSVHK
ncbi:hypothetical protein OIY81_3669, partial [Cryptosporidium canis]